MQPLGTIVAGNGLEESSTANGAGGGDNSDSGRTESDSSGTEQPKTIAGYPVSEPAYTITGTEPNAPKRRGRPPKNRTGGTFASTTTASTEKANQDLSKSTSIQNLEALLLSVHSGLAMMLSCPELELDETEAKRLADSTKNLMKHYPVSFSAKNLAWADFSVTLATTYGTRVIAIMKRPKQVSQTVTPAPKPETTPLVHHEVPKSTAAPRPLNPHEVLPAEVAGGENF